MISKTIDKMLQGDRRALAQICTFMERDDKNISAVMKSVYPHTGRAYCIGITGPPGVGKSTVVNKLIQILRAAKVSVGVLAIDPTSSFTGGSILGDRIRMQDHYLDEGVFIRSLATRGSYGGLSKVTRASVVLLDAFGKDIIIVESVGVGQTELDITSISDTVVVILSPESGDKVQVMKAGLMEIADIFVINKADRPETGRLANAIKASILLDSTETWWRPPILSSQAHKGQGIQELYEAIMNHRKTMGKDSRLEQRRQSRHREKFSQHLFEVLGANISHLISKDVELSKLAKQVEESKLDPYSAADEALSDPRFFSILAQAFQDQISTKPKISEKPQD